MATSSFNYSESSISVKHMKESFAELDLWYVSILDSPNFAPKKSINLHYFVESTNEDGIKSNIPVISQSPVEWRGSYFYGNVKESLLPGGNFVYALDVNNYTEFKIQFSSSVANFPSIDDFIQKDYYGNTKDEALLSLNNDRDIYSREMEKWFDRLTSGVVEIVTISSDAGAIGEFSFDPSVTAASVVSEPAPSLIDRDSTITGSAFSDILEGYAGRDTISGGQGDDIIKGGDEVDQLNGDEGDDILAGGAGADKFDGGPDRDVISYAFGDAIGLKLGADGQSFGQAIGDAILGGIEIILGSNFDDKISLGSDSIVVYGGGGNDELWGTASVDTLFGDLTPAESWTGDPAVVSLLQRAGAGGVAGNDTLYGSPGNDLLFGGAGFDVFDYQNGAFKDYFGFAAGTVQILDGGANSEAKGDVLRLPGSPSDYDYIVVSGDTWEQTKTSVQKLRQDGSVEFTFQTKDIENAEIAGFISNTVTLSANSVIAEMAELASKAYGDTGKVGRGWHAVSAMELGIKPKSFGSSMVQYKFEDGWYDATSLASSLAHANAIVTTGIVGDKKTLAIAFRGTSEFSDVGDYFPFTSHYAKFEPLIDGIKTYISKNQIDQVLVTGHSLGGAMVQIFMQDVAHPTMQGYTFGSPGADDWSISDDRIVNFIHSGDLVPLASAPGLPPLLPFLKHRLGADVAINNGDSNPFSAHAISGYQGDVTSLIRLAAGDDIGSPFKNTSLAQALRNGTVYTGEDIQIAPGTNGNDTLLSDRDDRYVLAGAGQDLIKFENLNDFQTDLIASGERIIDGGTGGDRLFLPFGKSEYQIPTVDGGELLYKPFSLGPGLLVGKLHRIEVIIYADNEVDVLNKTTLNVQTPAPGLDTLVVDGGADYTDVGDGDLTVIGSSAGDTIVGRAGKKTVDAGAGDDIVLFGGGAAGGDDAIDGGEGDDILSAGAGADELRGGAGNDDLDGGAGDDLLTGGAGADKLFGGPGNDTYLIEDALDQAFELSGEGSDTVLSTVSYVLGAGFEKLTLIGSDAINATGNQDANVIVGNNASNTLNGEMGNDTLIGGAGNDLLFGGGGADLLYSGDGLDWAFGGDGNDVLVGGKDYNVLQGGTGDDYLYLYNGGGSAYGGAGNDVAVGNNVNDILVMEGGNDVAYGYGGNDYFYMGDGADVMYAGDGVDVLLGEAGNDWFDGGAGTDYLFLGSGDRDTIVFNAQSGVDVVNQFETENDVIYLQGTHFTSFEQVLAATTDYGSFSVITVDANSAIWLIGVAPRQLQASDFAFA